jgi:hypothetical protein
MSTSVSRRGSTSTGRGVNGRERLVVAGAEALEYVEGLAAPACGFRRAGSPQAGRADTEAAGVGRRIRVLPSSPPVR